MKKIRVMQFGSSSRLLGAERWILALIKHSDSKQVEHVVTTIKDSELDSNDLISNVSEMGLKSVLISARGPFDVRVLWKLSSLIKKERIDILHTHGYKTDIIGFIAAKISGIRIISTPHGWSKEKDLKLQIYESIARSFLRFFDYVVPLSEDLKDGLIKGGIRGNRIKLIENSVDISEVEDALKSNQKIVNTENIGHKSIGYIGQLIQRKSLETLIKAFELIKSPDNIKLYIVGDGPERGNLEELSRKLGVEKNVFFTGFRDDRLKLLLSFDLFILPSILEGIPRCLMEAMAAQIPIVATDIPGTRDLIENNKYGYLVPPKNHEELAERITYALENHEETEKKVKSAREMVIDKRSASRMADEYLSLYSELTYC